jgi:uncharacterized protein YacL
MDINIIGIVLTIIIASVAWWANETLNNVPFLKTVVKVLIVVVSLLCFWSFLGIHDHTIHV